MEWQSILNTAQLNSPQMNLGMLIDIVFNLAAWGLECMILLSPNQAFMQVSCCIANSDALYWIWVISHATAYMPKFKDFPNYDCEALGFRRKLNRTNVGQMENRFARLGLARLPCSETEPFPVVALTLSWWWVELQSVGFHVLWCHQIMSCFHSKTRACLIRFSMSNWN